MKVMFLWIGKSKERSYQDIIDIYKKRLPHYCPIRIEEVKDTKQKKGSHDDIKKAEAQAILKKIQPADFVVLLDEKGKNYRSRDFSQWIEHKMNISIHQLTFVIAGAYGADASLHSRADAIVSLSHMTLTHDMARILILEQVYRAFTILRGEKYHNE